MFLSLVGAAWIDAVGRKKVIVFCYSSTRKSHHDAKPHAMSPSQPTTMQSTTSGLQALLVANLGLALAHFPVAMFPSWWTYIANRLFMDIWLFDCCLL